jgi:peptidoglycan/xylan/chitin deacetylase (PgdA/CDA1 family)
VSLRVALTFDAEHADRPGAPDATARLLDRLRGGGVPATFFVQGRWAEAHPALAQRLAAEGHLVGSHSHYHVRMPLLTDAGLASDLAAATEAIETACGVSPRPWFRCPFGAGADDPRVLAAVAAAGYRHVGWHVSAEDWDPGRDASAIAEAVVPGVERHGDGAVVLLHAWPDATLEALDVILHRLGASGASFCRIDQLADVPAGVPW